MKFTLVVITTLFSFASLASIHTYTKVHGKKISTTSNWPSSYNTKEIADISCRALGHDRAVSYKVVNLQKKIEAAALHTFSIGNLNAQFSTDSYRRDEVFGFIKCVSEVDHKANTYFHLNGYRFLAYSGADSDVPAATAKRAKNMCKALGHNTAANYELLHGGFVLMTLIEPGFKQNTIDNGNLDMANLNKLSPVFTRVSDHYGIFNYIECK